jgi:hypothetical protein
MTYEPPSLRELVENYRYKPGWQFYLEDRKESDGSGGLTFIAISLTMDSLAPERDISVRHNFLVPPASYNEANWMAWINDRVGDVEMHERNEFSQFYGKRVFAPHHSNGEDPYRTWYVSDHATAKKRSGED